jgi:DNA-directed RNA polymerase subunit RPC12/RpoP
LRQKLSIENPALAAQWDYSKNKGVTPDTVSAGSEYRAYWLCPEHKHSWNAFVYSRNQGRNCPYCSNQKLLVGFNDLLTVNPSLADEWDYENNNGLTPSDVLAGSTQHRAWKCIFGHTWTATAKKRHHDGQNCPYCHGNKVWVGFNDISTTHPAVAAEWNYGQNGKKRPEHYSIGADVKVWWRCNTCGHEWNAVIYSRKKCGCPACAGNILVVGKNDLRTVNSAVAAEWDEAKNYPIRAEDVAANDNRKFFWVCEFGHSYDSAVYSRNYGRGCPYCANRKLLKGFNDLQTRNPELAKEWDNEANAPLTAEDVISTSHDYAWWKCDKGHTWRASIVNRSVLGTECPYCTHRIVSPSETDLDTVRPDIAAAWDYERNYPLTPKQVTAWTNRKVWWLCEKCGLSYETAVASRLSADSCPHCHNKRVIPGVTDAATITPELEIEWDSTLNKDCDLKNLQPFSHGLFWWTCQKCEHHWQSTIGSRTHGSQCPRCTGKIRRRTRLVT